MQASWSIPNAIYYKVVLLLFVLELRVGVVVVLWLEEFAQFSDR
jgi:hypothetical protein